jgi:glycerol-3-phosphate dehydrogenase (NAD(P)+)
MKVCIIGTTSWGTTLAVMLARRDIDVALWARTADEAETLCRDRKNAARLPGIVFPDRLLPTADAGEALNGASLVILAVPSQEMRRNVALVKGHVAPGVPVLSAAKGFERESTKRMTQVVIEELGPDYGSQVGVLSGPNLSREIARGLPAATVIAAQDGGVAQRSQSIMHSPTFHVYTSNDVVGVELGGALKNIVALGAGMVDGLGYGDNAKAAYMSHGLTEIAALGAALGANPLTFLGLSGLGDLLATCASDLSRNHTLGKGLSQGRSMEEVMASIGSAVEGVPTTAAALKLAQGLGVSMPITERIYRVLFEGYSPAQAMAELLGEGSL